MADSFIITTASLLCICLCIPAISWRCFFADQLRTMDSTMWKDTIIVGFVAFLITSLINHLFWLVSSIIVLVFGRKGFKPVIWLWIVITWSVIILDFGFFGYFSHNIAIIIYREKGGTLSLIKSQIPLNQMLIDVAIRITSIAPFYMLMLLIHSLMAYLTIKVARYVTKVQNGNYTHGTIIKTEDPPYYRGQVASLRQPIANSQIYQNDAFAKSADDVRFGSGYRDRPSNGRFKQHPPEEPMRDYNDRRASRYNADFRY